MQTIDKINYKNQLSESVGLTKETKNGTIHYFDDNKIQRWYVIEESTGKDILAYASTPEELATKLSSVTATNIKEFNTILKYRNVKSLKESTSVDRLFYLDTLYGPKNHQFRKVLQESQQLPTEEKTYESIMQELDAYPGAPASYPQGNSAPQGTQGNPVNVGGAGAGEVIGALGNEIDFVLSDIFDGVMAKIKELRSSCKEPKQANLYHFASECMYDTRNKWIDGIKKRLAEAGQLPGTTPNQPVGGAQQPKPGV